MTDPVPSLADVQRTLLGGRDTNTLHSPDPSDGSPDGQPAPSHEFVDGLEIADPQAPEAAQKGADADRVARLEAELENERKRREDSQAAFHRENQARQRMEAERQEWLRQRQYEENLMRQAQQIQPPKWEGEPDEFIDKPEKALDYINRIAQFQQSQMIAQLHPVAQRLQRTEHLLNSSQKLALELSAEKAGRILSENGIPGWDENKEAILKEMRDYGPEGIAIAIEPDNLVNAYLVWRRSQGLPIAGHDPSRRSPDGLPPSPRGSHTDPAVAQKMRRLGPMAKRVAQGLGIGDGMKVTAEDLERVGLTE